jgi:MFS family permease
VAHRGARNPRPPDRGDASGGAWNTLALLFDSSLFTVGMSLIGTSTVLPAFIATLTDSPVYVGLASGIVSGAWLLPQLFVASAVTGLPRKKPVIVWSSWLSRPLFLLVAVAVWLLAERLPGMTLAILLSTLAIFFVFDAIVSIPWFDLLARVIPPTRRGRLMGMSQVIGGLGGIGAGIGIRYLLSEASPWSYPQNYALIFAGASVVFMLSAIGLTVIREPAGKMSSESVPRPSELLKSLPALLAKDRPFLRMVTVRILAGMVSIASAFFVLHATSVGQLALENTGLLISAQVVGSLAAGLLTTYIQDHLGPLVHIRTIISLAALPSLVALTMTPLLPRLGAGTLYVYLLVFFLLGLSMSSLGWPFFNWTLEYAGEERRPMYIGAMNTMAALVMVAPPLGGWMVRTVGYTPLFALAAGLAGCALVLSLGLPSTRTASQMQAKEIEGRASAP